MTVTGISGATQTELPKGVGSADLDRTDFMTLFITQMQYQDPMKPMDSYEMASQLAQFSNMEATMKMSDNMEELLAYQTSQNNLQLLTLLDKEVETQTNQVAVSGGAAGNGKFTIDERTESCVVQIYDEAGKFVRAIDRGGLTAGTYDMGWDGKNMVGVQVDDGVYTYIVEAYNFDSELVAASYRIIGKVTGVEYESGQAMLTLDEHVMVSVADILAVM
jgi:flagellar basal-body rod modification protein FlgD